jgi:hypothetical protein
VILRPRPAPVRQGTELGRLGAGGLGIGRRGTVHLLAVHEERNLVAVEGDRDMGLIAPMRMPSKLSRLVLYWLSTCTRSVEPVRKIDMCSASPLWKMASRE